MSSTSSESRRAANPGSRVHRARGLSSPGDYYHAADHGLAPRCRRRTTAAQTCRSVLQVMTASNGMSMFDYDARPVTPQVVLVGNRASSVGYTIRDFWSRNGVPYEWVDLDDAERVRALVSPREMDPGLLPICVGATAVGRGGWSGRRSQRCCPPGRWLSRRPCAIADCGPAVAVGRRGWPGSRDIRPTCAQGGRRPPVPPPGRRAPARRVFAVADCVGYRLGTDLVIEW